MIALIDYDAGNIKSVEKALLNLGVTPNLTRDPSVIKAADHVILPGVGSFGDAMDKLNAYDLAEVARETALSGVPFLGICLGQQLLFEESEESPGVRGLGILKGTCRRFDDSKGLKIPQIGWNNLMLMNEGRLFKSIPDGSYVYFVHTFYCQAEERGIVRATCEYANVVDASVEKDNIFACQFHPEKSGHVGLKILENFLNVR